MTKKKFLIVLGCGFIIGFLMYLMLSGISGTAAPVIERINNSAFLLSEFCAYNLGLPPHGILAWVLVPFVFIELQWMLIGVILFFVWCGIKWCWIKIVGGQPMTKKFLRALAWGVFIGISMAFACFVGRLGLVAYLMHILNYPALLLKYFLIQNIDWPPHSELIVFIILPAITIILQWMLISVVVFYILHLVNMKRPRRDVAEKDSADEPPVESGP